MHTKIISESCSSCRFEYLLSTFSGTKSVYDMIISTRRDDQTVIGIISHCENPSTMSLRFTGVGELKTRTISDTCDIDKS